MNRKKCGEISRGCPSCLLSPHISRIIASFFPPTSPLFSSYCYKSYRWSVSPCYTCPTSDPIMPVFRRRLYCHYCGKKSNQTNLRTFECEHCEAVNYLDKVSPVVTPQPILIIVEWRHSRSSRRITRRANTIRQTATIHHTQHLLQPLPEESRHRCTSSRGLCP